MKKLLFFAAAALCLSVVSCGSGEKAADQDSVAAEDSVVIIDVNVDADTVAPDTVAPEA